MSEVLAAMTQMLILFLIVILGFVISKLGYFDKPFSDKVSRILMDVTMPALVIASVGDLDGSGQWGLVATTIVVCLAANVVWTIAGYLIGRILHVVPAQRTLYAFMGFALNIGFMGLPLISALVGGQAVLMASLFILFGNLYMFTIGLTMLRMGPRSDDEEPAGHRKFEIPWKMLLSPAVLAALIAIVLFLGGIKLPYVLQESLSLVGGITGPLAMLLVGFFLSMQRVSDLIKEWRMYPYILLRQFLFSGLMVWAASFVIQDHSLLATLALMSCMPIGAMVPLFAGEAGRDALVASRFTVGTTVASFVSIPAMLVFLSVL